MGLSSSLFASISGLNTMGNAMSVLGDNVANVNTVAFKSSRSTFQDVLAQSVSTASGAAQVGRGVTLSTIDGLFAQGSFESSTTATDMAIGGQGFFILRGADTTEAGLYTRAGEFRFDQEGFLVTPVGHFVQGWSINSETGEIEGSIGDISIGKSTPPVATTTLEAILNLDSRKPNETTEDRLYANWDGTNAAALTPTDPIDATKYEYTTAIKVYDSKGASHDIQLYFDRTTNDNQWEFLVTCEPSEDLRELTADEQVIYNPDTRYNYENHKGAGALLYGTVDFDTSGNLTQLAAYKVPPDGEVEPSKNTNRILLDSGDSYISFPANFTGSEENTEIQLNFGARYEGASSTQRQVLVSDGGAREVAAGGDISNAITTATLWSAVADSNGNQVSQGDTFIFQGYDNGSDPVTQLVYVVDPANTVQDLLDQLESTFGVRASIDEFGKLRLSDNTPGDSSLFVTRFETISANQSVPFGGGTAVIDTWTRTSSGITIDGTTPATVATNRLVTLQDTATIPNNLAVGDTFTFEGTAIDGTAFTTATTTSVWSPGVVTSDGSTIVTDNTTSIVGLHGTALVAPGIAVGDQFSFGGTDVAGNPVAVAAYSVGGADTINTLLAAIENAYSVAPGDVTAALGSRGNIIITDNTAAPSSMSVQLAYNGAGSPWGLGAAASTFDKTNIFTVDSLSTVSDLLSFMQNLYEDGDSTSIILDGTVSTALDETGNLRIMDNNNTGNLSAGAQTIQYDSTTNPLTASPWGLTNGTPDVLQINNSAEGMINITTSKQQIISTGRALQTSTGDTTVISPTTQWSSVYNDRPLTQGGPIVVADGDTFTFDGTRRDGSTVNKTFTVQYTKADGSAGTVQDLLDNLEEWFEAEATIDNAGRLVLTDRIADTVSSSSALAINSITYSNTAGSAAWSGSDIFGAPTNTVAPFTTTAFDTIPADINSEDGSQEGDVVTTAFAPEALATSQYANASTTIFQDQNGFSSGFLQSVSVDVTGVLIGSYSNGQVLKKAQVALANFNNLAGLNKEGGNIFTETTESGAPITGAPGTNGLGSIAPNALEQSNVDLGTEFVKLITVQRGFQANSKIITVTDDMLNDLINIKR